jgi:hypothetical protein
MKCFCARKKTATTGRVITVDADMSMPKSVECPRRNWKRPRDRG